MCATTSRSTVMLPLVRSPRQMRKWKKNYPPKILEALRPLMCEYPGVEFGKDGVVGKGSALEY